jgi:c-di-GMP-binding flagellar brake protein YcgR
MNIITNTSFTALQSSLAHILIPDGMNLVRMNTVDEVIACIPSRGLVCLIDDNGGDIKLVIKKIMDLKKDETKKSARIFVITKTGDQELVKFLTQAGADAVFQSSLHYETIAEKFYIYLQKIVSEQHHERKYVRIKPGPNDDADIKFLIPSNKSYIKGKITDISMGGVAAKFKVEEIALLADGEEYTSCQMTLDRKNIVVDLKLVKKGGELVAFSFNKIRDSFRDSLSDYIFNKIQKDLDSTNPVKKENPEKKSDENKDIEDNKSAT